jgi:hypothetical protein
MDPIEIAGNGLDEKPEKQKNEMLRANIIY